MQGTLFIISAPSGAGKTTLIGKVYADLKNLIVIERVITYTTKTPRHGEKEGKDYHFISQERFDELLGEGFFMEYSKAYTDYYGSPSSIIEGLSQGISYLLIVDRVGAQEIIKKVPDVVLIWIKTPSLSELKKRLIGRGADSKGTIERRLIRAQEEMRLEKESPFYTHYILNNTLTEAVGDLKTIIYRNIRKKRSFLLKKTLHVKRLIEPSSGRI